MKFITIFTLYSLWISVGRCDVTQGISQPLYANLNKFANICMATYTGVLCPLPGGLPKVADITNDATDIHGWVLRDDSSRQIIAAFRGTESIQNYKTDINYTMAPLDILPACSGCAVHGGYYLVWNSILDQTQSLLQDQAKKNPGYGIVLTGHSLGGSMAALAAAQFRSLFTNMTVYTYGEPRTGNQAFASFINQQFQATDPATTTFFRSTHNNDGIPSTPPTSLGYVHHGVEYWNHDPTSAANTDICTGDELQCCEALNGTGINAAHLTYFGHTVVIGGQCL